MKQVSKPPKSDNRKNIAKAIFLVFSIAFLGCLFWAFNIVQEMNWPKTTALVVKTENKDEYGEYKNVYVSYQYKVDNKSYLTNELIGQFKNPKLEEILAKYKHGTSVDVAYNPHNPNVCALTSDSNPTVLNIVLALLGLFLFLGSLTFWYIKNKLS